MQNNFIKPERDIQLNPVDFCNRHISWETILSGVKFVSVFTDKQTIVFKTDTGNIELPLNELSDLTPPTGNKTGLTPQKPYTKFMALSHLKFNDNYHAAISYIETQYLNKSIPYIRVGVDYYKAFYSTDRYGVVKKTLKAWKKDEIKQDHGPKMLTYVNKFDDFVIVPDNTNHQEVIGTSYNHYRPFPHKPQEGDCQMSLKFIKHIFGDQYELGLRYLKVLYEQPKQPLPILCLVSRERQTGKTTFLNWMQMIFGDNYIQIHPEELLHQFNAQYATKNIIAIDETFIERTQAVEKIKSIATAKSISVNQKHISAYSLPFFGKIIISTNKEKDFMRIDQEEIRFWVRKIPSIKQIETKIEEILKNEIPALLDYLSKLPPVDYSKSRMVFTAEELVNEELKVVMQESLSTLHKEIVIHLTDFFYSNPHMTECFATPSDIKKRWFERDTKIGINYIAKVLKDEMLMDSKSIRYTPFDADISKLRGQAFCFKRDQFIKNEIADDLDWEKEPPF